MMYVPLDAGFCPSRWKHDVDVMLEKIPGVSRSDKLRIIQLLEADLNQVLRIAFVNTSGKAGAQIPQLPLGDDSSPWGR
jgi:hypothetical protein